MNKTAHFLSKATVVMVLALLILTFPQSATGAAQTSSNLFTFVKTVQVTPDEHFTIGSLGYIHYVPATDRFVVMLETTIDQPVSVAHSNETCMGKAAGYKEYNTDMTPTGNYGFIACPAADWTTRMVDNTLYSVFMTAGPPATPGGSHSWIGWHLAKYDAVTWEKLAELDVPLDFPYEQDGGPTIASINGQIIVSGEYRPTGKEEGNSGSHHRLFSPDLVPLGQMRLVDTPHNPELSILETEDAIYVLGAVKIDEGLLVLKYDKNWTYQGNKLLRSQAFFPTGAVWDGERFYVAYLDTSQRTDGHLPYYLNVRLAAYDSDWNTLDDVAVTTNVPGDNIQPGSPWLMLHGSQLFVSYIVDTLNATTGEEDRHWQAYVSVYELASDAP